MKGDKCTPPARDAHPDKQENNSTNLSFAGLETLRLLLKSPLNRFELGHKIMSGYAPNEVKEIRDVLGHDAIETERVPYKRRDGKTTKIGVYHLRDKLKAKDLLESCTV